MKTVHFNCFKVASRISLSAVASVFQITPPQSWEKYLLLKGRHLDMVLKGKATSKEAYIFDFGCITFVNFNQDETRVFLEYMESITGGIDYGLFGRFHESHTIRIDSSGGFKLWKDSPHSIAFGSGVIPIISVVLAKSTALYRIETQTAALLDEAEKFIHYLQKGKLRANTRSYISTIARILRFEYDSINSIRIFDRSLNIDGSIRYRDMYDSLAEFYELHERFDILKSKVGDLRNIISAYSTLSYNHHQRRLFMFEVLLLALFPLSYLIRLFI